MTPNNNHCSLLIPNSRFPDPLLPVTCYLLPVLVVPACEPGRGGGHLVRSMALVRELRALNREAWLYISEIELAAALAKIGAVLDTAQFDRSWILTESSLAENGLRDKSWGCVILDRFQTTGEELVRWKKLAPVIGIDEGGAHRNRFDFLIDLLPNLSRITPNIADPSLLPLPKEKPSPSPRLETEPLKVLVSFGLEDSAGLGTFVTETLGKLTRNHSSFLIPLASFAGTSSLKTPNLNEHLTDYDLIITHFGLTSFEALYAGVPVLPASPTAYHEKLARKAGFWTLGIGKRNIEKNINNLLKKNEMFLTFFSGLKTRCAELAVKFGLDHAPQRSLADLVNSFAPDINHGVSHGISRNCPVCGAALNGSVIARFPERSYRRCISCGAIGMNRINPMPIEYGREYFFERYQKQYGKTYIEDFPNLTAMAKRRLTVIRKVGIGKELGMRNEELGIGSKEQGAKSREQRVSLLDIGCAYGAFLAAAREEGFSPQGIDPAEDAVRYVTQTLGIPAVQGYFPIPIPDSRLPTPNYNVITLWYVIEHFRDCVPALAEIRKLLNHGGVLAFATPSFTGISGRSSLKRFLENSPQDHWTVWSATVCKKALRKAGFKVKKIVSSGHHPERFPLLGKFARNKNTLLYRLLLAASKIFALGDTIEVYAVKKRISCSSE